MRREKMLLGEEIAALHAQAGAFLIASYQGLDANSMAALRGVVAEEGGVFEVVKRRIFLKFAQQLPLVLSALELKGHLALLFVDPGMTATTKAFYQFAARHPGTMEVVAGYVDGRLCSAAEMEEISRLPSAAEMRAELLETFVTPLSATLTVMETLLTGVLRCLASKIEGEDSSS